MKNKLPMWVMPIIAFLVTLSVFMIIMLIYTSSSTKTETVYIEKQYSPNKVNKWLLSQGPIANAWTDEIGGVPANCFETQILKDNISVYAYCKLNEGLVH